MGLIAYIPGCPAGGSLRWGGYVVLSLTPAEAPGDLKVAARSARADRLDAMMVDTAAAVLPWLAGFQLAYSLLLLTGFIPGAPGDEILQAVAAGLTGSALIALYGALQGRQIPFRYVHGAYAIVVISCGTTILVRLYTSAQAEETLALAMLIVLAGATMVSPAWLTAVLVLLCAGWRMATENAQDADAWEPFGRLLLIAVGAAGLAYWLRLRRAPAADCHPVAVVPRSLGSNIAAHGELEGLWEWDLGNDAMYFSPRWRSMLGYAESEIDNTVEEWMARIHPDDSRRVMGAVREHLNSGGPDFELEHRIRQADGSYRWVTVRGRALHNASGRPERVVGSQADLRRLKWTQERLEHDARHDRLTGLANRVQLIEQINAEIAHQSKDPGYLFAVAYVDLDRFKQLNDTLGHATGDVLLSEVGERLEETRLPHDLLARVAGDEFVALFRAVHDGADAMQRIVALRKAFERPFEVDGRMTKVSASMGLALASPPVKRPEDLMRNADMAMSRAKSSAGGDRLQLYEAEMHLSATRDWQLRNDLAEALTNNQFQLYFQPLVSLSTGRIVGAEALLRWRREGRHVPPSEFVPIAEEVGTIVAIGEWVLREACRANKRWQSEATDPVAVSVNVSAKQLPGRTFPDLVRSILEETGVQPGLLQLELTESQLLGADDGSIDTFNRLSDMGVRTAIDDFGTGFSSLDYLRKARFKTLKIDPTFIRDLSTDQMSAPLTQSLIEMAHGLQLSIVAEGVETAEQLEFLRRQGCDVVQGYLASPPIDSDEFLTMLRENALLLENWLRADADPPGRGVEDGGGKPVRSAGGLQRGAV